MQHTATEASYPLEFRVEEAKSLGEQLRFRHNVELVGMKHVGIGNFLSFFLNHAGIVDRYINHGEKHLFITVDLNDLVEREIHPFWVLLFKRVVDSSESIEINPADKKQISSVPLIGAGIIELHTGRYAEAKTLERRQSCFQEIVMAAEFARGLGLRVNAGHGLDYENVRRIAGIKGIEELNIGYSIICNSVFWGLESAVRKMRELIG